MIKYGIHLLIIGISLISFSCSDDDNILTEEDLKKDLTDENAATIMFVNLSEDGAELQMNIDGISSSAVSPGDHSAYSLYTTGSQTLTITSTTSTALEEEVVTEAGKAYTAYLSGNEDDLKLYFLEDNLEQAEDINNFKVTGLNLSSEDSISFQVLYPQYQPQLDAFNEANDTNFSPWATATGWFEAMGEGVYSDAVTYIGNTPLNIRAIVADSEFLKDYTSFDDPDTGEKIFYHLESTAPLQELEGGATFSPAKVYTLLFYGDEGSFEFMIINKSDAFDQ